MADIAWLRDVARDFTIQRPAGMKPEVPPPSCGNSPYATRGHAPGVVYCDGVNHLRREVDTVLGFIGRCPYALQSERARLVAAEHDRLWPSLRHKFRAFPTFENYRAHDPKSREAYAALRAFALPTGPGTDAPHGVAIVGPTGIGKTHLLLAGYVQCLSEGVRACYARSSDLREWFQRARSAFGDARREEAEGELLALQSAEVVFADEIGEIAGDESFRGAFADGLKRLLDRSCGRWAWASNNSLAKLQAHPDVGDQILSRLLDHATVVKFPDDSEDARLVGAK